MPRAVWLLSFAAFIAAATTRVCDALLPNIAASFDVSIALAASAVTAFTLGYGLFQLVYGPIGARIGPYRLVIVATVLAASGAFVCAFADDLALLAAGRFWSGMTAAAIIPMSMAYIGNTVDYRQRQTVLARFLMGQVLGVAFGQASAGLFAELLDWRELFVLLGGGFLLAAAALALEYRGGGVERRPDRAAAAADGAAGALAQYRAVLALPWARTVLLTVTLEGFFCFGAFPFIAVRLERSFGLDYLTIGTVMALLGAGGLIYIVAVRQLLRLLGEIGLARAGGALMLAGFMVVGLSPVWPPLAAATLLIGLGFYMLHNTLQTNATQMAPFDRSSAISLFAFALFVSQAVGAAAFALLGERFGFTPVFVVAGAALLLVAMTFAAARRRRGEPALG